MATEPLAQLLRQAVALALAVEAAGTTPGAGFGVEARGTAAGVIYNAAMIPGWPFPSALVRDDPKFQAKALRELGQALDAMTAEEMADYLAAIGANYGMMRRLRRLLRSLDGVEVDVAVGFVAVLLSALRSVFEGLRGSLEMSRNEATMLATITDSGDVAPQHPGPTRRRIKL